MEAPEPEKRQVTAIMSTAMVGPGSQLQSLEFPLLEEHARLVRELLPRHGGREVKMMEDGFLLEFERGLSAVRFGVALQERVAGRNRLAAPDQRMELRVGVHLGPVVHQNGEVFGEGVNLAARLEALAQPGTLYVSEAVAREVEGHPLPPAHRLGRSELKRIRLPVAVFRIEPRRNVVRPALFARFRSLFFTQRRASS
ncbi:adenylate/guanylate cyclase domain-containing protein [Hyalangium rubrum]|uniref:Adenylate/guanylate cyclase domain-containing protein n=1 Tax=Hyalangium rubrum TaxID=3103134 RepID=A0ABU5HG28_9BACT|nr:adenylate/guanylate cyclase domain-containing protein [Hyalangium sp. s54d21]MDY7232201.1 adenylate/guanylate cyclase domain-containing protein [Hyalangium sp. s54d21]